MEYSFRKSLRLALCVIAFATTCQAEKPYLVIQVADIHNQPVAGIEIAAKGSSESGTTDRFGRARIKLDTQAMVNDWVVIQIVKSPAGKDLKLISPWDGHARVPPFENETSNFLPLFVATRGDPVMLENGKAITTFAAQINKATSPISKGPDSEERRREALEATAKTFGLAPGDVDKAIRAWGERATDLYEKGLADLYEKNYPLASRELSQSLEMRERSWPRSRPQPPMPLFFLGNPNLKRASIANRLPPTCGR